MNSNEVIKKISFETFKDIISHSTRKVRESLYSFYGVKTKPRGMTFNLKDKKEQKIKNLQQSLVDASSEKEQEFLKELFKNWLFHQRELLKKTLDFLNVQHDEGLVETELDFFKNLKEEEVKNLVNHVKKDFPKDHILIYFSFVEVPGFEKYL